jgi:hypothetical protein
MASRFDHLRAIFQQPSAERPKSAAQREAERRQLREDLAEGQRLARKQAAQQAAAADPEAFHKQQALKIIQAGARARGIPVPTRLEQDRKPSDEYPDGDNYNSPGDPDDGGDDAPTKPKPKKAKPAKVFSDEGDEDAEGGDETEESKNKAIALQIINAGRRARNLPLLTKLDQDR